ncbi:MAG: IS5/IS1182 family transposase, partial [Polyangiaceae bacterium]
HNLKRFRAVATRYEKTARNYLALVQLACARLWLEN